MSLKPCETVLRINYTFEILSLTSVFYYIVMLELFEPQGDLLSWPTAFVCLTPRVHSAFLINPGGLTGCISQNVMLFFQETYSRSKPVKKKIPRAYAEWDKYVSYFLI